MAEIRVALTPRQKGPIYLAKANDFAATAEEALAAGRLDGALLCAVHAAISATDAVCVALDGRRSVEADHQRAADLLEDIGGRSDDIKERVRQLRGLLRMKNLVEYEARAVTPKEADDGVKRCRRLLEWAQAELVRAKLMA